MPKMLSEIVEDHLIDVAKNDGRWNSREEIYSYLKNALNEGAIAGAISKVEKTILCDKEVYDEIVIFS